ncbi:thioredoxin domain-containing protein [Tenacibaculum sp. 1B UA]|uniref:vitamin K epoxide reductase family protein n=1 Tax=Tenacibaculum sp. 1B UA TaxID=2922252 RepID=UPI002A23E30D|nr:vitamin K epoxide reductase family protein [Tenacibaculum sp. 1B UA]MDX8554962.1 thioredoxin domain-containing protein [Tenacibaculum sp. 1B UA]
MEKILFIIIKLFKEFGYSIEEKKIKLQLFSDPDEGILPITNTLNFFKIKNVAAKAPKNSLDQLPDCFLAQLGNDKKSDWALVSKKNNNKVELTVDKKTSFVVHKDEFISNWTGLIIAIEKKNKKESILNQVTKNYLVATSLVFLSALFLVIETNSFIKTSYFALCLVGLVLSILILIEKNKSSLTNSKFCSFSNNTDCTSVLNSEKGKILSVFDLSDLSVIYFSFLTLAFMSFHDSFLFYVISYVSIPIVIYSLYQQFFNIKKWCPLCLAVSLVLVAQFFTLLFIKNELIYNLSAVIYMTFLITTISSLWYYFKTLMEASLENEFLTIENTTFRKNYKLFFSYFKSINPINKYDFPTIRLGSTNPTIIITGITNPLCESCFEAHDVYKRILNKFSKDVSIDLVFFVPYQNRQDPRTKISERLLQLYIEKNNDFNESFNHWYERIKIEKWTNKWGECTNSNYNKLLEKQVDWCRSNNLEKTPSILINGKKFPEFYRISDLELFIEVMVNK